MKVITFYSYKGGVGRTLACANFGKYLAKTGQKVVLMDMDLEAPGLDSKLFPGADTNTSSGLMDQLTAFQDRSILPGLSPIPIVLNEEVTRSGGRLHLIPAGNYRDMDTYHQALSKLNWNHLLRTEEGLAFWFDLLARIEDQLQPDVLVIDSRTGITEVGGLCTHILPDTVVLMTSTSPESLDGTRRIYQRIRKSRLIEEGRESEKPLDLRVVLTRVPRKDDAEAFDQKMRLLLNLEVPRLYYLFSDDDLATSEYIAIDQPEGKSGYLLSGYVDLFASLNPENMVGYIKTRLTSFRDGLTVRKEVDSRRVIQELVTLFPRSEVFLEAARYYRLVKEPELSIANYLNYLRSFPSNKEIIVEFAEVCTTVPLAAISEQRELVLRYLVALGPASMDAATLSMFCALAKLPEQLQAIVASIEEDPAKLTAHPFRGTLFRALAELQEWGKLVASATDIDLKDAAVQRMMAKAYAKLHAPDKALQIIRRLTVRDTSEFLPLVEILYDLRSDVDKSEIRKSLKENRFLSTYLSRYAPGMLEHPNFLKRDDGEFRAWIRELFNEKEGS